MQVKCSHCGNESQVKTWNRINTVEHPELKQKLQDASLFVWECPHCGKKSLISYETLYHDPDKKVMLWLHPEGDSTEQADALKKVVEQLDGYILRIVSSPGELLEKVAVFEAGLDDVIVEMCKYVTQMEMVDKYGSGFLYVTLRFFRLSEGRNEIILSFPFDNCMQSLNIGFNVYEDCSRIIKRNPSIRPTEGFSKVDAKWLSQYFR